MNRLKLADLTSGVGASGLSSTGAQRRLAEFGRNEIRREQRTTAPTLLASQFASPVIWLLLGASVLSAAPVTARVVARELGILAGSDAPEDLVHARATPRTKLGSFVRGKRAAPSRR